MIPASEQKIQDAFRKLMILREGERLEVYQDSRGLLTCGIGHLVTAADDLALGEAITQDRSDDLFAADGRAALDAAYEQAADAGITSTAFIPFLASVNFQLGVAWCHEFPQTWACIVAGEYEQAAVDAGESEWARQTPVRVLDFQTALRELPPKTSADQLDAEYNH
jgi:lysozyme